MTNRNFTVAALLCALVFTECVGQNPTSSIERIDGQLKSGKTTVSAVLSSDSLMYLHPLTPFREMIKSNAKPGKIKLAADSEPGTRITVKGYVTDASGKPMKDVSLYVYHTSDKGWYAADMAHITTESGDVGHARLFGYLKTDEKGEFTLDTVKPRGYPQSNLPAHIHIHYWIGNGDELEGPGELLFDDDDRLTPSRRQQAVADGYLIAKNTGTPQKPVFEYHITLRR